MKKLILIILILVSIVPSYSGCWKYKRTANTGWGGYPEYWGGSTANANNMYYLERIIYIDTILNEECHGSICWATRDCGKTFTPLVGYVNNAEIEVPKLNLIDTVVSDKTILNENRRIQNPDTNSIYLYQRYGFIFISKDNGKTWKIRRFNTNYEYEWRDFNDFVMYKNGFGAFTYTKMNVYDTDEYTVKDSILITADDFKTTYWSRVHNDSFKLEMKWLSIPDTNTIYVVGDSVPYAVSYLYKTQNKGISWERVKLPTPMMCIRTVCFMDSLRGWIGGQEVDLKDTTYYNYIYRTDDGGKNWSLQMHDTIVYPGIKKILYSDSLHVFAIGNSKMNPNDITKFTTIVYHSSDGGKNWILDKPDTAEVYDRITDLAVGGPDNAYIFVDCNIFQYEEDCEASVEGKLPPMPVEIKAYPNPATKGNSVSIDPGNTYGELLETVYIYDTRGNELTDKLEYSNNDSGQLSIKLSNELSSGAYMIVLQYGINRIKYCKVVVE